MASVDKCSLAPEQRKEYLGGLVDSVAGTVFVPEKKRLALRSAIDAALGAGRCQLRAIASIIGTIVSMSFSFGSIAVLMTRHMIFWQNGLVQAGATLDSRMPLSDAVIGELRFWQSAAKEFDGYRPLWLPSHMHSMQILYTDAAGPNGWTFGGWGGWTQDGAVRTVASGRWDFDTTSASSTALELRAMLHVVQSVNQAGRLDNQRVLIRTDSQCAAAVLNKGGSRAPALHELCLELFWYCIERGIHLVAEWIPRTENVLADDLSKRLESCDWMLNPQVFAQLQQLWGPFHIDLFASHTNHLLPRYYSFHHTPDCVGVNAFAYHWGRSCWCNPPFAIIGRVLQHAALCGARMCMIVPFWPGSVWWPALVRDGGRLFRPFVWACEVLTQQRDLFLGGAHGNTVPQATPQWRSMALLLDFRFPKRTPVSVPLL